MIQRIQTIYLALAAISLFLTVIMGFCTYQMEGQDVVFSLFGLEENANGVTTWFPYKIVIPFIAALCLFNILQYKNRKLQMNVGRILLVLLLILVVFLFIDVYTLGPKIAGEGNEFVMVPGVGMYLPVIALPFVFLANRRIKKDDELIKSVDRLR